MANIINVKEKGFDELEAKLKKAPLVMRAVQSAAVSAAAYKGRKEDRQHGELHMGRYYFRGAGKTISKKNKIPGYRKAAQRVFSKYDPKKGWVSTSLANGGVVKMGSFAWDTKTQKWNSRIAYTSLLANLWGKPTKPYKHRSPCFGQENFPGAETDYGFWKEGAIRDARFDLKKTQQELARSIPRAIQVASQVFDREMADLK